LKAFASNGQTTGPASGGPPPVVARTTQAIKMGDCTQVGTAAQANSAFCRACQTAMKSHASGSTAVTAACTRGGSCTRRRLSEAESEAESEERRLSTNPVVNVAYTISFPPNTNTATASAAVVAATNPTNLAAFTTSLNSAFTANGGTGTIANVAPVTAPTVVVQPSGYDCKAGQTCYFNFYAKDTHYKIYRASHSPAFSASDCATACTADSTCEAYEYLTSPNEPACSFWKNGACNIGNIAAAGNPPGYVTGISYATWCDKSGSNNGAFTPVTSSSKNSCIFGFGWVLSAFLMVSMTG